MRTRIASFFIGLALLGGLLGFTATPAAAAGIDDIKVCSSSESTELIRAYKSDESWSRKLYPGYCTPWINDTGSNPVRVQIYGAGVYTIGIEGQGYSNTCHWGPNPDSNPPSGEYPRYIKYRYDSSGYCFWL